MNGNAAAGWMLAAQQGTPTLKRTKVEDGDPNHHHMISRGENDGLTPREEGAHETKISPNIDTFRHLASEDQPKDVEARDRHYSFCPQGQ